MNSSQYSITSDILFLKGIPLKSLEINIKSTSLFNSQSFPALLPNNMALSILNFLFTFFTYSDNNFLTLSFVYLSILLSPLYSLIFLSFPLYYKVYREYRRLHQHIL